MESPEGTIPTVAYQDFFICHFFNPQLNTCGIYHIRPFECRLYPFLLIKKSQEIAIGVHLLCPYIQEKRDTSDWQQYVAALKQYFTRDDVQAFLLRNPALIGDYKNSRDEIEPIFTVSLGRKKS